MEALTQYTGDIVLERIRDARPIRSFIRKKLLGWFQSHGLSPETQPHYHVALNRHQQGHLFTCQIDVESGDLRWSAMVTARDLHQALLSALNHMSPQKRRIYAT